MSIQNLCFCGEIRIFCVCVCGVCVCVCVGGGGGGGGTPFHNLAKEMPYLQL